MLRSSLIAFFVLFCGAAAPLVRAQDEKVALAEFDKYMASKDTATRLNQLDFMGKLDSPAVAKAIIEKGLRDPVEQVRIRAAKNLGFMRNEATIDVIIQATKDKTGVVREGACRALGKIATGRSLDALGPVLAAETDSGVIVAILQGLAAAKKSVAPDVVAKQLNSKEPGVVIAAIDALGASGDPKNASYLNPLLKQKDWSYQTALVKALSVLRAKSSIPGLIEMLAGAKGRIAAETRDALVAITGWEFGTNAKQWQDWWAKLDPKWDVPQNVKKVDTEAEGYGKKATTYHKIKTESKRLFFVIDISSSMLQDIRFQTADGAWHTERRIDLAKEELIRCLKTLDENTDFGILAFEAILTPFKPSLTRATAGGVDEAVKWVQSLTPPPNVGTLTTTEEGYTRGETNSFAALKWIYGQSGKEVTQVLTSGGTPKIRTKPVADTIFFLSDGEPSCGEMTIVDDIIEKVQLYNQSSRVIINTICFEITGIGRKFLEDIARITGGKSVVVGNLN